MRRLVLGFTQTKAQQTSGTASLVYTGGDYFAARLAVQNAVAAAGGPWQGWIECNSTAPFQVARVRNLVNGV